jgi:hypothetical protein
VNRLRDPDAKPESRQGGGIAIAIDRSLVYRDLTKQVIPVTLRDMEMVIVQIVNATFEIYAINIYIADYREQQGLLKTLHNWVVELIARKPTAIFLIAGDFNCA